ncbi:hypothetical protein A6g_18185 [Bacillus velezensis]|nr:hypothetical protein C5O26_21425 [Bacillus velezensis]RXK26617.1 hypothetical protein A6g_18185 [Bacillus velezensis]
MPAGACRRANPKIQGNLKNMKWLKIQILLWSSGIFFLKANAFWRTHNKKADPLARATRKSQLEDTTNTTFTLLAE